MKEVICEGIEEDFNNFIMWQGSLVQNLGSPVGWSPLLMSAQKGIGKTLCVDIIRAMFGSYGKVVSSKTVSGNFTGYKADSLLIVIEEIHIVGAKRETFMNNIKDVITNKYVAVERKGVDPETIENFTNLIATSNYTDALKLDDRSDRRWFILNPQISLNNLGKKLNSELYSNLGMSDSDCSNKFFKTIARLKDDPNFIKLWVGRLMGVDISNIPSIAPDTHAREILHDSEEQKSSMNWLTNVLDAGYDYVCRKHVSAHHLKYAIEDYFIRIGEPQKVFEFYMLGTGSFNFQHLGVAKVGGLSSRIWSSTTRCRKTALNEIREMKKIKDLMI